MSNTTQIYLTRHGQSIWQIQRDENWDTPLTDLGHRQARRLGQWLAAQPDLPLARLRGSTLERARQTGAYLADALQLPLLPDDNLRDAEFWIAPHLPSVDHPRQSADGWQPPPIYTAFKRQARQALDQLVADTEEAGGPVLAVAHGGLIATMLRLMVKSDHIAFWSHNTALHKIEWSRGRWQIMYLNRLEHLPDDLRTY